jgi:hypothetical protein
MSVVDPTGRMWARKFAAWTIFVRPGSVDQNAALGKNRRPRVADKAKPHALDALRQA